MESQVAEWQELMGKMRCSKGQKGKGAAKGSDSKGYDRAEMAEVLELAAQRMAQYYVCSNSKLEHVRTKIFQTSDFLSIFFFKSG